MKINYELDKDNRVIQWRDFPLDESLPTIEIKNPYNIQLGIDRIIDGKLVADLEKRAEVAQREVWNLELAQLKKQLADTDYQAIKFAEGELTAEEYEPIKQQRKTWRKQVNSLLTLLAI